MSDEFDSVISDVNAEYQSLLKKKESESQELIVKAQANSKKLIEEAEVNARKKGTAFLSKKDVEVKKEIEKLEIDFVSKKKKIKSPGKGLQVELKKEFLKRLNEF